MATDAKLTPDVMIEAPKRSPARPNHDATKILYTSSSYSFAHRKTTSVVGLLSTETRTDTVIADGDKVSNPVWLDHDPSSPLRETIVALKKGDQGLTHLNIGIASNFESSYTAGTFEGPVNDLLVTKLPGNSYGVAVSGKALPDGSLYNPETAKKPHSSGMVWSSLFVRRWDEYVGPERNSIWYAKLEPSKENSTQFAMSKPVNALQGTKLESPLPPFPDASFFHISPSGLVFVAKDPKLNPALHTTCNIYIVRLSSFTESSPQIYTVKIPYLQGALASPRFSPDGKQIAFLAMKQDGYEADRNQLCLMPDVDRPIKVTGYYPSEDGRGAWDRSPSAVTWSRDAKTLFLTAEHEGTAVLFSVPAQYTPGMAFPAMHPTRGSVVSIEPLHSGKAVVSTSAFADPSVYSLFDGNLGTWQSISSATNDGDTWGYPRLNIRSMTYPGTTETQTPAHAVQCWVARPPDFDPAKRYPVAIFVHGGPQGAWLDTFAPRWCAPLVAAQGFLTLLPNITGSTGFGAAHTDAIRGAWTRTPYEELEALLDFLAANVPYADTDRAVLLGGSFGGFMANLVAGKRLGRRLRALVSHAGILSASGMQATDEIYFPAHDFGARLDEAGGQKAWGRHEPLQWAHEWKTPMLMVHGERDYRVVVSEALAAFNVLQSRGVESRLLLFPDEGHFCQKPENALVWYENVLGWLCEHVGLPVWKPNLPELRGEQEKEVGTQAKVMDPERATEEGMRRITLVE